MTDATLGVLGLSAAEERLYLLLLRTGGPVTVAVLGDALDQPADDVREHLQRLDDRGLVEWSGYEVRARPPAEVLPGLVAKEARRLRVDRDRLDAVRQLVPRLTAEHEAATAPTGEPVTVERIDGGDVPELMRSLAVSSSGDLLWLRLDQWRLPHSPQINSIIKDLMASGRRSRAIYPARVLEEAPHVLLDRAEAGEHVRILAEVPMRLGVMGRTAALVSENHAVPSERRLVIRQRSLVGALTLLFECLWEKAVAVPGFEGRRFETEEGGQRLLLGQLADGAKDEQIARVLGISVRTVRRRVADLLAELDADSRFQAGVEAVRRGWL